MNLAERENRNGWPGEGRASDLAIPCGTTPAFHSGNVVLHTSRSGAPALECPFEAPPHIKGL
jgi:hypothetical protein